MTAQLAPPSPRLASLDTLRVACVAMVIVHHAGQAYSPVGGFWPVSDAAHAPILGPFFSVNASFGMPLLFLLSGYFVPGAFDRKGARRFLRDRFVHLGGPLLRFSALGFAPVLCVAYVRRPPAGVSLPLYLVRTLFGTWHLGHLWFLADLLFYVSVYAGWRTLRGSDVRTRPPAPLRQLPLVAFTLILAALTFAVRVRFPIDQWASVLGVLPIEPAHFVRDTAFFAAGIVAYRRGWLGATPLRTGIVWLAVAVAGAATCFAVPLWSGGGFSAASLRWSLWETFLCTGFCVGLTTVADHVVREPPRLVRLAVPAAFGAYVIHVVPVLGLQLLLVRAALPALAKFALVSLASVPLSFLFARRVSVAADVGPGPCEGSIH